jgi:uncharacterized protein with von Willebrand factor type A (vWA) domain
MQRTLNIVQIVTVAVAAVLASPPTATCQSPDDDLGIVVPTEEEDPRLRLAEHAKEAVERAEEIVTKAEETIIVEIDKALVAINKLLDQLEQIQKRQPNQIVRADETFKALRAAAVELLKLAKALEERQEGYTHNLKSLKTAMETAPAAFREAAKAFLSYAQEEEYTDLRIAYGELAAVWETLATRLEDRSSELIPDSKEITEALQYLGRTSIFLERLVAHIDAIPQMEVLGDHPKYLEQLQRYIKSFERVREQIRILHNDICTEAVSSNLRAKPAIEVAQKQGDPPSKPTRPQTPLPMYRYGDPVPAGGVYGSYVSPASYNFPSRY